MANNEKAWFGGFKRLIKDESLGETLGLAVGNATKQLHIIDIADADTDWALSADSYPAVYIHGSASASEYIKLTTDSTDAHFNVVGANLDIDVPASAVVSIQVNNTDEYEFSADNVSFSGNTLGSAGNLTFVTGRTIIGTSLVIDASGSAIRMANAASWNALGTGTVTIGLIGPAAVGSVSVKAWLTLRDAAGTTTYYLPAFAA